MILNGRDFRPLNNTLIFIVYMGRECIFCIAVPERRSYIFSHQPRLSVHFYGPNLPKLGVIKNHQFTHLGYSFLSVWGLLRFEEKRCPSC